MATGLRQNLIDTIRSMAEQSGPGENRSLRFQLGDSDREHTLQLTFGVQYADGDKVILWYPEPEGSFEILSFEAAVDKFMQFYKLE